MARARTGETSDAGKLGLATECWLHFGAQVDPGAGNEGYVASDVDGLIYKKGPGWEIYKAAAIRKGADPADFVETATTIEIVKGSCRQWLSLFDIVFLNNGAPPSFIKDVKDMHAVPPRLDLHPQGHWVMIWGVDDYRASVPYGGWEWPWWQGIKASAPHPTYYMQGTGLNSQGILCVDADEGQPWPGGVAKCALAGTEVARFTDAGHAWLVDYIKNDQNGVPYGYSRRLASLAADTMRTYWNRGGPNGMPVDAFVHHDLFGYFQPRFGGTGYTNKPTMDDGLWNNGSCAVITEFKKQLGAYQYANRLWHACGQVLAPRGDLSVDMLHNQTAMYYNFNWQDGTTEANLRETIRKIKQRNGILVLGNQLTGSQAWTDIMMNPMDPFWDRLLGFAREVNWSNNIYLGMNADPNSVLFYHPAIRSIQ